MSEDDLPDDEITITVRPPSGWIVLFDGSQLGVETEIETVSRWRHTQFGPVQMGHTIIRDKRVVETPPTRKVWFWRRARLEQDRATLRAMLGRRIT